MMLTIMTMMKSIITATNDDKLTMTMLTTNNDDKEDANDDNDGNDEVIGQGRVW